ncbi:MAG: 4Fe-4S dicluster domain-containing protein [Ignavibacteriales bacterium]|nr:4Fe-4S dicluster domain-containing protein [Ignavibacteriales bacterium]
MLSPNQIAKELLESGKVAVVVGYASGTIPGKTQTLIAKTPQQAEKFVFNKYCVNNLATYLNKSYKLPKPIGIFVKGCDAKTIVGLIQEHQINREDVYIIGLPCEGVTEQVNGEVLGKCRFCNVHIPKIYDVLAGEAITESPVDTSKKFARLDMIEQMPIEQRWDFWMKEFDKCVRCYACRQACPLCYCEQCIVDKTQPRWIESSAHQVGNLSWHFIRAFHLAGRCIGCGECERVCHQNIPLGLLNMKMAKEIFEEYGYVAGVDAEAKPPLTDYKMEDDQHFIR